MLLDNPPIDDLFYYVLLTTSGSLDWFSPNIHIPYKHYRTIILLFDFFTDGHILNPIESVKNFMDHSKRKNTERYTARAEEYSQKHNYDWFKRILKDKNRKCRGKYVKNQNIAEIPSFRMESLREGSHSPDQIRTGA